MWGINLVLLTYAPNVQLFASQTTAPNPNRSVKIAIIQLSVPCDVHRILTHQAFDCAFIERVGQQLHVWNVVLAHDEWVRESLDGHVGQDEEGWESNAVVWEKLSTVYFLRRGLLRREGWPDRVINKVKAETSGGTTIAMFVKELERGDTDRLHWLNSMIQKWKDWAHTCPWRRLSLFACSYFLLYSREATRWCRLCYLPETRRGLLGPSRREQQGCTGLWYSSPRLLPSPEKTETLGFRFRDRCAKTYRGNEMSEMRIQFWSPARYINCVDWRAWHRTASQMHLLND